MYVCLLCEIERERREFYSIHHHHLGITLHPQGKYSAGRAREAGKQAGLQPLQACSSWITVPPEFPQQHAGGKQKNTTENRSMKREKMMRDIWMCMCVDVFRCRCREWNDEVNKIKK